MDLVAFGIIREIIVEQAGISPENILPTSMLFDNDNIDSIDQVEILMAIEERFDVIMPNEVVQRMTSVSDLVKYLDDRKGNAGH